MVRATVQLARSKPPSPDRAVAAALEEIVTGNGNAGLRINAVKALENWGTPESIPALQKAAKDPNRTLQVQANRVIEALSSR